MRLAHREVRPELRLLQHDADALPELAAGALRIVAEHRHLARVARAVALEDLDGRRLPGAVRAEQPEDLALLDLEVDALDRCERAVRLPQAADGDRLHAVLQLDDDVARTVGNGGSGPSVNAATAWPQSGWWPTTSTVSPRPSTASRMSCGVAPGASRSSTSGSPSASTTRGLARAQQRAREDCVRLDALLAQAPAELARLLAPRGRQGAKLVRAAGPGLGMTNDHKAHRRPG